MPIFALSKVIVILQDTRRAWRNQPTNHYAKGGGDVVAFPAGNKACVYSISEKIQQIDGTKKNHSVMSRAPEVSRSTVRPGDD